ncbi:MAG: response regulator transcription factor [Chloroflexi bacterium]|nr:response regulator transcription factor [Chloroflexota bacterium]
MERIGVLLVDSLPAFREALRMMLETASDLEVVGEASDCLEALGEATKNQPRIVLISLGLNDLDRLEFVSRARRQFPETSVIALGTCADEALIADFAMAGCRGYLFRSVSRELLIHAIRAVNSGGLVVEAGLGEAASRFLSSVSSTDLSIQDDLEKAAISGHGGERHLTPREREVLDLLVQGYTNKLIGETLQISDETAKRHVRSIIAKLGACDRTQAAVFAVRGGITR